MPDCQWRSAAAGGGYKHTPASAIEFHRKPVNSSDLSLSQHITEREWFKPQAL